MCSSSDGYRARVVFLRGLGVSDNFEGIRKRQVRD